MEWFIFIKNTISYYNNYDHDHSGTDDDDDDNNNQQTDHYHHQGYHHDGQANNSCSDYN